MLKRVCFTLLALLLSATLQAQIPRDLVPYRIPHAQMWSFIPKGWVNHIEKPNNQLLADFTPTKTSLIPRLRFAYDARAKNQDIRLLMQQWMRSMNEIEVYQNLKLRAPAGNIVHIVEFSWKPPALRQRMHVLRAASKSPKGGVVSLTYEDAYHTASGAKRRLFFESAKTLQPIIKNKSKKR